MKPVIEKHLLVWSGHLTKEDVDILNVTADGGGTTDLVVYEYKYGWYVQVPEFKRLSLPGTSLLEREDGFSKQFAQLLYVAYNTGSEFVTVDRDGAVYHDLESYDWPPKEEGEDKEDRYA
jgi:hypothetical protein